MPLRRAWAMAGVALLSLACGRPELEGSLSELLDLHYQKMDVIASEGELSVRFTVPLKGGENVPLAVSLKTADLELVAHGNIDLAELINGGPGQRGVVTRNVLNDPRKTFPPLQRGTLRMDALPTPGGEVPGQFSVTFAECIDFGCGRTVFGSFRAAVPK